MNPLRIQSFTERGDIYLREALNTALTGDSRLEFAFDALYMYALCVVSDEAEALDHPDPAVLREAASILNVPEQALEPALQRLSDRRQHLRNNAQLDQLVTLAQQLKNAAARLAL